jgi:hypothetical protein
MNDRGFLMVNAHALAGATIQKTIFDFATVAGINSKIS